MHKLFSEDDNISVRDVLKVMEKSSIECSKRNHSLLSKHFHSFIIYSAFILIVCICLIVETFLELNRLAIWKAKLGFTGKLISLFSYLNPQNYLSLCDIKGSYKITLASYNLE